MSLDLSKFQLKNGATKQTGGGEIQVEVQQHYRDWTTSNFAGVITRCTLWY